MSSSWISLKFGKLDIIEVYLEFNGPKLFSCHNEVGQVFLALWVEEYNCEELWLYILISLSRLSILRAGNLDLHHAFLKPENNFIYQVKLNLQDGNEKVEKISSSTIDTELLPLPDTFFRCEKENPLIQLLAEDSKATQNAIEHSREIVNLRLVLQSKYKNEVPSSYLGSLLNTFQFLVNSLGKARNTAPISSEEIQRCTEFSVFATSMGSFQIELGSATDAALADLFDNSLAGDAIEELLNLIRVSANIQSLRKLLSEYPRYTAPRYRNFLESLVNAKCQLDIYWGSPTPRRGGKSRIVLADAIEIAELIKEIQSEDPKELIIIGELFKIDKNNWSFGIREINSSKDYKGEILENAKKQSSEATISKTYQAKIQEIIETSAMIGSEKISYQLVSLTEYVPSYTQTNISS